MPQGKSLDATVPVKLHQQHFVAFDLASAWNQARPAGSCQPIPVTGNHHPVVGDGFRFLTFCKRLAESGNNFVEGRLAGPNKACLLRADAGSTTRYFPGGGQRHPDAALTQACQQQQNQAVSGQSHKLKSCQTVNEPPAIRLMTGTAKIRCAFGKCAMTTQQTGIAIAPTMKASAAK